MNDGKNVGCGRFRETTTWVHSMDKKLTASNASDFLDEEMREIVVVTLEVASVHCLGVFPLHKWLARSGWFGGLAGHLGG